MKGKTVCLAAIALSAVLLSAALFLNGCGSNRSGEAGAQAENAAEGAGGSEAVGGGPGAAEAGQGEGAAAGEGAAGDSKAAGSLDGSDGAVEEDGAKIPYPGAGEKPGDGWGSQEEAGGEASGTPDGVSDTDDAPGSEEERFVRQKIVVATDIHYLAESLSGNRCQSFMEKAEQGDGGVFQYGWELLDAFLDDMLEEEPDLVILSGDLTMDGERESHEELAEKLEVLTDHGIEVAVLPGNHDINSSAAKRFTSEGTERTESVTAEEFRSIYADFGYVAADDRDPWSLSYLYKLDDYTWLLMLDTCQYEPMRLDGGMVRSGTYDWMESVLDEAWEQGAEILPVSHHNLLEQSGVSQIFYDDCTIEHNEELVRLLADYDVRLHLSGHLHIQHYMQDEDSGIYEIVTGSMMMAPCPYGVLQIWNDGTLQYDARQVDVEGWAARHSYKNQELSEFNTFSRTFLARRTYQQVVEDLKAHILGRRVFLTDERIRDMAQFYAKVCVYYYGGQMWKIADEIREEEAYEDWLQIDYVSELSDFLKNILEDPALDYRHLEIPY